MLPNLPRPPLLILSLMVALVATGCAHKPGPIEVASAYAQALEEKRLEDAYELTTVSRSQKDFLDQYWDASVRQARVAEVRKALPELHAQGPALTVLQTPVGWRVVEKEAADAPRETLSRFLNAVKGSDWPTAWSLLSAPLRARYTPERLRDDFKRDPLAAERVRRARLALREPVRLSASGAEFPIGDSRAVRLVREAGEYRVAAIE